MKTFCKAVAFAAAATFALQPTISAAEMGERDETYHALVDCGSVEIVMAAGAETEAEKQQHTDKAVMWVLVAGKYAEIDDFELVQTDSSNSVQKLLKMTESDDDAELLQLLSLCQELEPVVQETYTALKS